MEEHDKARHKRVAQHKLAQEVLTLVHGDDVAKEAEQEHRGLFGKIAPQRAQTDNNGDQSTQSSTEAVPLSSKSFGPTQSLTLPKSLVYGQRISHILYHAGLAPSRSEGYRMVTKKGVYIGARPGGSGTMGEQVDFSPAANWEGKETHKYLIGDDMLIMRVGKWKVKIIKIISDVEFEEKGLSAPGWKEENLERPLTADLRNMKPWHKKNYVKHAPIHQELP